MDDDAQRILDELREFLEKNPDMRFGQALFSLGILENEPSWIGPQYVRDPFYDTNQVVLYRINRAKKRLL